MVMMILVMFETWWDKHLWTQRLRCRLWKSLLQCWRCREPAPTIGDIELLVLKHFDTQSDIRNFDIALNILTHILSCQNLNRILMSWWIFPSISPWSQYLPTFDGGMCTSIQFGICTEAAWGSSSHSQQAAFPSCACTRRQERALNW